MAEPTRYSPDDYWKCIPPHYAKNFEPHWAVKIYLDPRGNFDKDSLVRGRTELFEGVAEHERMDRALCFFDFEVPGWIPTWFPSHVGERKLSPAERLEWFDQAMTELCDLRTGSDAAWDEKQRFVAIALVELYELARHGEVPLPAGATTAEPRP